MSGLFDKWRDRSHDEHKTYKPKPRCHTTHQPITLGMGEIVGACCGSPRDGYDIYIGLCSTMKLKHQKYPWEDSYDPIIEFQFNITDGCAPGKPAEFRKMIEWVAEQLDDGKKVHVGCIGGHGRTGTFLAALVSLYEDLTDDPIAYVRKEHCAKAVESESQLKFLNKHWGIKIDGHKPSKPSYSSKSNGKTYPKAEWYNEYSQPLSASQRRKNLSAKDVIATPDRKTRIPHMAKKGSIWG